MASIYIFQTSSSYTDRFVQILAPGTIFHPDIMRPAATWTTFSQNSLTFRAHQPSRLHLLRATRAWAEQRRLRGNRFNKLHTNEVEDDRETDDK